MTVMQLQENTRAPTCAVVAHTTALVKAGECGFKIDFALPSFALFSATMIAHLELSR